MNQSSVCARFAAIACGLALAFPAAQAQPDKGKAAASGGGDMMSMMRENNDKMMAMKPTGDPDVDFAMMMHMHHQGGIRMAEHEIANGKNAEMKKMARKIRDSQKKESAEFERFLSRKGHQVSK